MTAASPRRLVAAALVIVVHGVLLALLLRSVMTIAPPAMPAIEVVNIAAPPPPPPPPLAAVAAAPARPTPSLAPAAPPRVAMPPVDTAPTAPAGNGTTGTASPTGESSTAASDGGGIVRAVHVSGAITNRDYPRAANAAGVGGSVTVVFDVRADGRVEQCRVVASSGSALLDSTTCALIEQRFVYDPARDARGEAIADVAGWKQDWWLAR